MAARPGVPTLRHARYVILLARGGDLHEPGGLERYLRDEMALLDAQDISTLLIFPFPTRRSASLHHWLSRFWGVCLDGRLAGLFRTSDLRALLAALSQANHRPVEVHVHHLQHFDLDAVQRLLADWPIPIRLFLHDYYTVCPQYTLMRNGERFCGSAMPSPAKCAGCRHWTPAHNEQMRALLAEWGARLKVIAPSAACRDTWLPSFPGFEAQVEMIPHLLPKGEIPMDWADPPTDRPIRLAFVGAPHRLKGWEVFRRLAQNLGAARGSYELLHFGMNRTPEPGIRQIPVSVVRQGPEAMTKALRQAGVDLALLWSLCPETYSYALWECRLAGALVLTNPDSGNIAYGVAAERAGRVLTDEHQLADYLRDVPRVRADLEQHRREHAVRPRRLALHDGIVRAVAGAPSVAPPPATTPPPRAARAVTLLYRVKLLKKRFAGT